MANHVSVPCISIMPIMLAWNRLLEGSELFACGGVRHRPNASGRKPEDEGIKRVVDFTFWFSVNLFFPNSFVGK